MNNRQRHRFHSADASCLDVMLENTSSKGDNVEDPDFGLKLDEVLIIQGALDLNEKCVAQSLVPLESTYMVSANLCLSELILADLVATGHSRVLVYEGYRTNIRGFILLKKLIVINPEDHRLVNSLYLHQPEFVFPSTKLLDMLTLFRRGFSHLAVVTDNPIAMAYAINNNENVPEYVVVYGICTLEDIIETLIQRQIKDESDIHELCAKQILSIQHRKQRLLAYAVKQKALKIASSQVSKFGSKHLGTSIAETAKETQTGKFDNLKEQANKASCTLDAEIDISEPLLSNEVTVD